MALIQLDRRIHEHFFIEPEDVCYFLREYTARQSFSYSDTNQLIQNFKKSPSKRNTLEWTYKTKAISQLAAELLREAGMPWLTQFTLIPVPPSKCRTDEEYDDRMLRLLRKMGRLDIRDMVIQRDSIESFHFGERRSIESLKQLYKIDNNLLSPVPNAVLICDDVLTNGTHFKAIQSLMQEIFPGVDVQGLFIARCVHIPDTAPESNDEGSDLLEAFLNS